MNSSQSIQSDLVFNPIHRFISAVETLERLFAAENVSVRPYVDRNNLHFARLPYERQLVQLKNVETYTEVCQDTVSQGHSLKESGFLLWNMLRKLGLKPTSDLFSQIRDDQVFEIYNSENVQIFRNINFFNICSYTMDELLNVPWWQLYLRDEEVSRQIFIEGSKFFSRETIETICPPIKAHLLEEIASESKYKMILEIILMSPLSGDNNSICCFVAEEVQMLNN